MQSGWLRLRESAAARGSRATEGAGDTRLTLGYAVPRPLPARIYLDLSLAYKWATAETGLGTGADDQQVEAEFLRRFGATLGFVSLAYRRVGDPPDRDLRDRRQLGLGVSRSGGAALSYGLSLDYRSPLSGTGEPALEWVPFLAWRVDRHWTVSAYAVLGQADGSPDRALGMQLGRRWQD